MISGHLNSESTKFPLQNNSQKPLQKFKSIRRTLKLLEIISQNEELCAKQIAKKLGMSLSNCYALIGLLIDEGYVEKSPAGKGYRLGPVIPPLYEAYSRSRLSPEFDTLLTELAQRAGEYSYFATIEDNEVTVTDIKKPTTTPSVGVAKGFHGASHALALGKILLAYGGDKRVDEYIDAHGLEPFTPKTIIHPPTLKKHLYKVRLQELAMDNEEFSENLCCIAAPIKNDSGEIIGAIGISTTPRIFKTGEAQLLTQLVRWAASEATTRV